MTTPVPAGRGRWRLTLHRRDFGSFARPSQTGIAELTGARSRRLEQAANTPATFTFSIDGAAPAAAYIQELTTDVIAWRWDEVAGRDIQMFRGVIAQSQDSLSEQAHTVNFTAHDYLAVLTRRFLTAAAPLVYTQRDQDDLVADLVTRASNMAAGVANRSTPAPACRW